MYSQRPPEVRPGRRAHRFRSRAIAVLVGPLIGWLTGSGPSFDDLVGVAHAQPKPAESLPADAGPVAPAAAKERIAELNRQALADYAANDFESARLGLREAIMLASRAGLTSDPVMAQLWADLGALYINGFQDQPKAQKAFSVAVKLHPNVLPSESLLTPEVRTALAAAGGTAAQSPPAGTPPLPPAGAVAPSTASPTPGEIPGAAPPPTAVPPKPAPPRPRRKRGGEPDLPAEIPVPLYCPNIDEAPPNEDVVIHCVLQPEIVAKQVQIFYRAPGVTSWSSSPTTTSPAGWIKATIPGSALPETMIGKSLQFYLEARNAEGKQVARAGRDDSPNLLLVNEVATTLSAGVWAGMQAARKAGDADTSADEDPLAKLVEERAAALAAEKIHRRRRGLFISLSAGTGYGWHPTERLEFYDTAEIASGWIPSGRFFLAPGVAYQLGDHWAVGVEGRIQLIAQQGSGDSQPGSPARGAFLLLGRLQYLLGEGNLQGTASLLAGAGDGFRLTVGPQSDEFRRNDSVRGGPMAVGGGLGVTYHFSPHLALVIDGRALAGFSTQAFVLDVSGGLAVGF